ncbi:MAG: radical SAM protein [Candidatus Aenigmatarchaeota archaeon]
MLSSIEFVYIASYLLKNTNHQVKVLDAQNLNYEDIRKEVQKIMPDLVGITTTSFTLPDAILTAKIVKSINDDIHVNLGGPHMQIYPIETVQLPDIDSVVIGDGEITLAELANSIEKKESLKKIRGVMFKENEKIIYSDMKPINNDLDSLPFPDRTLLPVKEYSLKISKKKIVTSMIGSRGCPYSCNFCFKSTEFRYRSVKNLVDEIEECISFGIEDIQFYDETFTFSKIRTREICDEIIKRKLNIDFGIRTRTDLVDRELMKKLKKAGCVRINYGVESGNPKILKEIGKDSKLERIKEVFRITKNESIEAIAYFMIGFPNETKKGILDTIDFAIELDPDYCIFSMLIPYPGTKLYKDLIKSGFYMEDFWRNFALNPLSNFTPRTCNMYLSREQLLDLLEYAYKQFYFRPRYIIDRLRKMRSIHEFKNHLKVAYEMLKL